VLCINCLLLKNPTLPLLIIYSKISEALKLCKAVKSLDLGGNNITHEGMHAIATNIKVS
jgi:hypothetical protein